MDNLKHFANTWLGNEFFDNRQQVKRHYLPDFNPKLASQETNPVEQSSSLQFNPLKHFTLGWTGEGLASKEQNIFSNTLSVIAQSVKNEFLSIELFHRSFIKQLFAEYSELCKEIQQDQFNYLTPVDFWNDLRSNERRSEVELLETFLNLYCHRTAIIFVMKLRFIDELLKAQSEEIKNYNFLCPGSIVNKLIREENQLFRSKAFSKNIYSWWQPKTDQYDNLEQIIKCFRELSISQIIKVCSQKTQIKSEKIKLYSHSLSHKNFGLFINSLLINFPLWQKSLKNPLVAKSCYGDKNSRNIISCKFTGDYLESLAHSHWLAQDNNKDFKWDDILCSEFKSLGFSTGHYFNILNELQFMSLLAELAWFDERTLPAKQVRDIINKHYCNKKESSINQISLFDNLEIKPSTFNRIILNLSHFPKNNPHYYLIGKIQEHIPQLKPEQYLVVCSNKKLFIPSLKEKLDQILEELYLEASIDLAAVSGKGEVPSYIYLFSKKISASAPKSKKIQPCFTFRFSGDLESFHHFQYLNQQLQQFYRENLEDAPSMYVKEFNDGFKLEFYRDAVSHGRLMHSSNKNTNSITHPQYFKKLLQNCTPLDHFFECHSLEHPHKQNNDHVDDYLMDFGKEYPYLLVIDCRMDDRKHIHIFDFESYQAIVDEFGFVNAFYFGLKPLIPQININVVREFFKSQIGKQISTIHFQGEKRKIKQKVNSILIPKFINNVLNMSEEAKSILDFFITSETDLLDLSPAEILESFTKSSLFLDQYGKDYPSLAIGLLVHFKNNLQNIQRKTELKNNESSVNYNNPLIKIPLVEARKFPIQPNNPDIYVKYNVVNKNELYQALESVTIQINGQDKQLCIVSLMDKNVAMVELHCPIHLGQFIYFILSNSIGKRLFDLLTLIQVPRASEIQLIVEAQQQWGQCLGEINESIQKKIDSILSREILNIQ